MTTALTTAICGIATASVSCTALVCVTIIVCRKFESLRLQVPGLTLDINHRTSVGPAPDRTSVGPAPDRAKETE
jgi:hypothetical protein